MIISHKYKFIFIKTRKTAGTSIETYLSQYCGAEDVLTPFGMEEPGHEPRNYKGFRNHLFGHEIQKLVPEAIWNNYFKFCVERNPWDKALSHYYFYTKRFDLELTFDEYLKGRNAVNTESYTDPTDPDKIIVDRIIRYETLKEELGEVFGQLGIPFEGDLGVRAKGGYRKNRRPYPEVINEEQRAIIAKIYAQEIRLLGYEF